MDTARKYPESHAVGDENYSDIVFMIGNRAQVSPGPAVTLYIMFLVVVVAFVVLVGMDIATEFASGINESAFQEASNETTAPPTYYSPFELVPVIVVVLIGVVIVGLIQKLRTDVPSTTEPDKPDDITVIKNAYMNGDIQTTAKLERELEDTVEPYLDDSDVQEIDDLLDGDTK